MFTSSGGQPPAIVVAIVVHPSHRAAPDNDDVLRGGHCGSLADEATELGVAAGDDQWGILGRRGVQVYHAVGENRLGHLVSPSRIWPALTSGCRVSLPTVWGRAIDGTGDGAALRFGNRPGTLRTRRSRRHRTPQTEVPRTQWSVGVVSATVHAAEASRTFDHLEVGDHQFPSAARRPASAVGSGDDLAKRAVQRLRARSFGTNVW